MAEPFPPAKRETTAQRGATRWAENPGEHRRDKSSPPAPDSRSPHSSGGRSDQRPAACAGQGQHGNDAATRPPAERPASERQAYAAIDLGTNNCRLLIARPAGENFVVIDAFSRVVRLGEGLAQSGRLSDAAMDRALAALRICADKLRRRNVHLARSVATEACRRAANGAECVAKPESRSM